ncbi:hypothetical protein GJ744_011421 [Endocarpon pusillum]|uniref:Utp8 beta-propeller domain-containing protein n=1 Tax=Endocarpon pusillum TaxID=364733 RepID=A0A8H7AG54_9EURO|nr:hypothetical protein GJ744_011421 [Endocarpon pusillum]
MSVMTPTVLAQLPQSLLGVDGRTQFGPCYGFTGSRKRKRTEIAAAVDGEALNIYDVQGSRLVSSYAVPPTCLFSCPPCSVRQRQSPGSKTTRYTVCAVQRPEHRIQCYEEEVEHTETPVISSHSHMIEEQSPAIHIEFIPIDANRGQPESSPDVIVVHHNGTVRRLSSDLKHTRWVAASVQQSEGRALPLEVLSAHWVSNADASTGLLRRREDILKDCAACGSSFLILVHRDGDHQKSGLRVGVFNVPMAPQMGFTSSSSSQLRLLLSNPIPGSERWGLATDLHIDFHAPSARLSVSSRNELINYDLSAYIPGISSKLAFDDGHSSLFALDGNTAAGASRSAVQIYDINYQSVKARFGLGTKSRRRGLEDSARKAVRFILYFAKINVLVAVRGRNLIAFNLPRERVKTRCPPQTSSLLIESLGSSTYTSTRVITHTQAEMGPGFVKALFVPNQLEQAGWEARQKSLDELVQRDQVKEFEPFMADELQDTLAEEKDCRKHTPIKLPSEDQFVRYDKIHYLLSKIFHVSVLPSVVGDENNKADVVIVFFPPTLFQWLALHSHLRTSEIERASSSELSQPQLRLGAVAISIMKQDPSLGLLADYLRGANVSGLDEAVTIIKVLIKAAAARAQGMSPPQQLLDYSHAMTPKEPINCTEKISTLESSPSAPAGSWSETCTAVLVRTLDMLRSFSPVKITTAIRTYLDTDAVLALIQILRQQLFQSGCTSSSSTSCVDSEDAILAVETTVLVLCSCIDALGSSGFLGSTFDQGLWQDLVPDLKSEISLALAGIEEATYLKGVIQEVLRYGNAATSNQALPTDSPFHQFEKPTREIVAIMKANTGSMEEQSRCIREGPSLLPLSLDLENSVSKTKKRKGGGETVERSARELQYLKSRNIGRYSFERLIL